MRTFDLAALVRQTLGRESSVVSWPDHPILVTGPNLLAGGPVGLTALFLPAASELRDPATLLQRLTATRLAFPAHTRCVLWLELPMVEVLQERQVLMHFHQVVMDRKADITALLFNDPHSRVRPIPTGVRSHAYLRARVLFHESERTTEERSHPPELEGVEEHLRELGYRLLSEDDWDTRSLPGFGRPPLLFERQGTVIGAIVQRARPKPLQELRQFIRAALELDYSLDQGIPYLSCGEVW